MNPPNPDAKTETAKASPSGADSFAQHAPPSANLPPPEIPDYELIKRIGQGSYGEVWLARNVMGTCRAVKIVYRHAFQSDRPFEREFDGIKNFEPVSQTNENQLKIFHVGRREAYFYYVMELADDATVAADVRRLTSLGTREEGQSLLTSAATYSPKTLRSEIQRRKRLPVEESLDLSIKLTQALAHLHRHGLVHRDIKPSNIIFVNGLPKLADIGLVADTEGTLSFVGTEGYLPPEGPGKPPADIFSLGKVIYEISTGHDRNQFPELPTLWDSAPEREAFAELNEVIIKACAAEEEKRYETAERMHQDLLLVRAGKSLRRLRVMERRFRELTRAAAVLAILGVIVTAGLLYQRRQTTIVTGLAKRESTQRQRAETALTQTEMVRVSEMLERGDVNAALMQLARTLRNDPTNRFAAERLMAAINQKNFLLPVIGPLHHEAQINSACFSPDGRWIATASRDGIARIWNATTGQPPGQQLLHGTNVNSIQFSLDSRSVVTAASDGTARVWEVEGEQTATATLRHDRSVQYAEFSPTGQRILTLSGTTVRLWEMRTGQWISQPIEHATNVAAAQFSPDGGRLITGAKDGTARIWDAASGEPLTTQLNHNTHSVHGPAVTSVQFSPDSSRVVTASYDHTARVWDARTGALLVEPLKHDYPVQFARFSADGRKILTGSNDRTARIWDAFTGQPLIGGLLHDEAVWKGEFSPNGRWIVTRQLSHGQAARDMLRVWDAETGAAVAETQLAGFDGTISPDGSRVLAASGQNLLVLDALPGEARGLALAHSNWVGFAQYSPDGTRIVTTEVQAVSTPRWRNWSHVHGETSCTARIWDARKGTLVAGPLPHAKGIVSAQFSPDGKELVTGSRDQTARVWDVATGRPVSDPLEHPQVVRFARFTPDGQRVVTSCWLHRAWLWEISSGKMLREFHDAGPGEGSNFMAMPVRSADLSADGRWLVTCSWEGARVWDVITGKSFKSPFAPDEKIQAARFSPDGERIVTASEDQKACVWDVQSGKLIASPLRHNSAVVFAQFSPDGRKVVTCSLDRTARIWDAETGQLMTKPLNHQGEVLYAEFSPDSRRVVTASWWDKAALLWDAETGLPLSQPLQHEDWVNYATFSPDGRWIVTASNDRKAKLWEIPLAPLPIPDWLPDLAEAIVGKRLNAQGLPETVSIEELIALKQQLISSAATDDYTRWAKWLFADRSQRTISAFSAITVPEYVENLLRDDTQASLEEAVRLSPTNGLAYARLARRIVQQTQQENPRRAAEADFYSRYAVKVSPEHPEVLRIRAEIKAQLGPGASAN